ncbi:uncharacterized protein ARMOST_18568 [Armillaria ostoyae]|uniref:Uncharacterized protein n=1 Tax=Armillaria ostoyae TaxID=47428 RepID=A0A284S280_ARMOS|nr:uncharacterized protein ARMOST_18568 [Armillaria ostoyae]
MGMEMVTWRTKKEMKRATMIVVESKAVKLSTSSEQSLQQLDLGLLDDIYWSTWLGECISVQKGDLRFRCH